MDVQRVSVSLVQAYYEFAKMSADHKHLLAGQKLSIGIGAPLSGSGSHLGKEMDQAIQLAIDEVNALGGVLGAQVHGVVRDDEGLENVGLDVARRFASSDVLAVVGHYNSNVTLTVAPTCFDANLPLVSPIVSNPKLTESGWTNVFRFTNRDDETAKAIADYSVGTLGKFKAVVVATRTTYGESMSNHFSDAFGAACGLVVSRHDVSEGHTDFDPLVLSLPVDIDLVFYGGTFEGAPLLKAMRQQNKTMLLATGDGCWDQINFLRRAGDTASAGEGVLVLSACPQLGMVDGSIAFAERYETRFGPIANYAVNAYDATRLLLGAIRNAAVVGGDIPCRRRVLAALRQVRYQGIAYPSPVEWDENGDNRAALTALHVVRHHHFEQIAVLPKSCVPSG